MRTGVQKNNYHKKDLSFERTFGAVSPINLPEEYNADLAISFPDQNADGLPNGCTGYTVSEIGQDENGELFDPRFTYEKTLAIANLPPNSPCKVRDALKESRTFGLKRKYNESTLVRGAYFDVDKVGDYFDGIRNALEKNKIERRTVLAASPWFHEWLWPKNGILPAPKKYVWDSGTIGHCYKICGWKTINHIPYLIIKPWCGAKWGDKGYAYMSRDICNKTFAISGTALYIQSNLTPGEVKTVKLDILELLLAFYRRLLAITKPTMPPEAPPIAPTSPVAPFSKAETLYQAAKSSLGTRMIIDPSVPNLLGCASSVSGMLIKAGYKGLPAHGISGTAALYDFLIKSKDFRIVPEYKRGLIIMSQSGVPGSILAHGHVGITGDHGIVSNDSDTGLVREEWDIARWTAYYHDYGKLPITFFEWITTT